jgi:hypothetical protein
MSKNTLLRGYCQPDENRTHVTRFTDEPPFQFGAQEGCYVRINLQGGEKGDSNPPKLFRVLESQSSAFDHSAIITMFKIRTKKILTFLSGFLSYLFKVYYGVFNLPMFHLV